MLKFFRYRYCSTHPSPRISSGFSRSSLIFFVLFSMAVLSRVVRRLTGPAPRAFFSSVVFQVILPKALKLHCYMTVTSYFNYKKLKPWLLLSCRSVMRLFALMDSLCLSQLTKKWLTSYVPVSCMV